MKYTHTGIFLAYSCIPSSTITAIVPSAATAMRDPFNLPRRSSPRLRFITVSNSVINIVHRATSFRVLSTESIIILDGEVQTHRASQHAIPPSSSAPSIYSALLHSSVTNHNLVAWEQTASSFDPDAVSRRSSENVPRCNRPFALKNSKSGIIW